MTPPDPYAHLSLATRRLGPLPLVGHYIEHLGLPGLLNRFVPTESPRTRLPHAKALGVLLRSLTVEREPVYRQHEIVQAFSPAAFGLRPGEEPLITDDRLGRALDCLFDADRGSLLTEVVVAAGRRFGVKMDELHNDSTSIRFTGQYLCAKGRLLRGRRAPGSPGAIPKTTVPTSSRCCSS